jgi:hypothetical protein
MLFFHLEKSILLDPQTFPFGFLGSTGLDVGSMLLSGRARRTWPISSEGV